VAAADVDLVEVGDAAVACRHGDVFELDVHVVFGFEKLATVDLARGDFEGDDVALCLIQELDGNADGGGEFAHCGGISRWSCDCDCDR